MDIEKIESFVKTNWKYFVAGIITAIIIGFLFSDKAEAHDCGGTWQEGYIQSEPYCWQEAIPDASGGITYITVCK